MFLWIFVPKNTILYSTTEHCYRKHFENNRKPYWYCLKDVWYNALENYGFMKSESDERVWIVVTKKEFHIPCAGNGRWRSFYPLVFLPEDSRRIPRPSLKMVPSSTREVKCHLLLATLFWNFVISFWLGFCSQSLLKNLGDVWFPKNPSYM